MAQKTDAQLLAEANVIKNETQANANSATRVGNMLVDIVDSKPNNVLVLPKPILELGRTAYNELWVKFADTSFLQHTTNPEIFLFRWRKKRNAMTKNVLGESIFRIKAAGWVHPTTHNSTIKWAGWRFFSGKQHWNYGGVNFTELLNRQTEFPLGNAQLAPYERIPIGFNKYMFRQEMNGSNNTLNKYDTNIYDTVDGLPYSLTSSQNVYDSAMYANMGGAAIDFKLGTNNYWKIGKFCFALAVDNPAATKTNGLCPKIFSEFSLPFYSILTINPADNHAKGVTLIHQEAGTQAKIRIHKKW